MTRARRGLTLMSQAHARNPMLAGLNDRAFLIRQAHAVTPDTSKCMMHYQTLDLSQVDLSFAGRLREGNSSLKAIRQLRTGDPVSLVQDRDRWVICDKVGTTVGRLARSYQPPLGTTFERGEVAALAVWRKENSEIQYQDRLQQDRWNVVVPEFVFRPSS